MQTDTHTEPPAATPASSALAAPPRRSSLGRKLGRLLVAVLLVGIGVVVGALAGGSRAPSEASPAAEPHPVTAAEEHPSDPHAAMLRRVDLALRAGRFADALEVCRDDHAAGGDAHFQARVRYREGLCLEGLGRFPEAAACYTKAQEPEDDVGAWARATLGRIRTMSDDPAGAWLLLHRVVLVSGHPDCEKGHILAECLHVRAQLLVRKLAPPTEPDPYDPSVLAWAPFHGGVIDYLDWLPEQSSPTHEEHPHDGIPPPRAKIVTDPHHAADPHPSGHPVEKPLPGKSPRPDSHGHQKPPEKPSHVPVGKHLPGPAEAHAGPAEAHVDAHGHGKDPHAKPPVPGHAEKAVPARPVVKPIPFRVVRSSKSKLPVVTGTAPEAMAVDVIRTVGLTAGLAVEMDPAAAGMLSGLVTSVAVEQVPLPLMLDALTQPAGLGWRIRNGVLDIRPEPKAASTGPARAIEALQTALELEPAHPSHRAEQLALANLLLSSGHALDATRIYRELLDDRGHAPEAALAAHNQGLHDLHTGDLLGARSRFLEVLDRRPAPVWRAAASWWIARSHLDAGDFPPAMQPLQLVEKCPHRKLATAASLGLCMTSLLQGHEDEARLVRTAMRNPIDPEAVAISGWIDALFRYRVYPSPLRGDAFASAAKVAKDGAYLGPAGPLLTGRVYREMGRLEPMADLYDRSALTARGPIATEMTLAVADHLDQTDRREAARVRYLALAAADLGPAGAKAELRLAEIAMEQGKITDCIRHARSALARRGSDREDALRILGRGYETAGEYRRAADCFAGRVPLD